MTEARRSAAKEIVYACVRVVAAWVFLQHGAQKFGMFGGMGPDGGAVHFPSLMGWAAVIELGGGTLILLGLFTRVAAFIASGEMAVAFFKAHFPNHGIFTILNHGESAALLSLLFLYFVLQGPGPYSVDALISKARAKK